MRDVRSSLRDGRRARTHHPREAVAQDAAVLSAADRRRRHTRSRPFIQGWKDVKKSLKSKCLARTCKKKTLNIKYEIYAFITHMIGSLKFK